MNTKKDILIITHNDGSTVEVEPCKLSHPCHHGQPCYCGRNQGEQMKKVIDRGHITDGEANGGMAEPELQPTDSENLVPELTHEEARMEHIKAVYYARKVILQYGTPSEKMATSRAMKKMEARLGIKHPKKRRNKKRRR